MIPKTWGIPEIFRSRLGEDVGRQRLMCEEDQFLIILHQIPDHQQKSNREPALFWIDDNDQWKSMPAAGGRRALAELVLAYGARAESLDDQLDKAAEATKVFEVIEQATPILRACRNMLAVVQQLRENLPDDSKVLAIRDNAIKAERAAELLMSDAKATLDFQVATSAAKQAKEAAKSAKEAKRLNRLAAMFFPTVTLASIFGMNAPSKVLGYTHTGTFLLAGAACGVILWAILKSNDKS